MRDAGLTIDVLTDYVELVQQGDQTIEARKQLLVNQREELIQKMEEMQKTLNLLNYKIEVYESAMLSVEKELKEN
jgi:DNA-binding transcriptional MerR regulator